MESLKRNNSTYGITSEEEYLTAGGSDTEVGENNDTDTEISFAKLTRPEIIFFNCGPMHLQALTTLSLSCEVSGSPEPEVKWFKEGRAIRDGELGFNLRKITTGKWNLFVSQVSSDHSGEYGIWCVFAWVEFSFHSKLLIHFLCRNVDLNQSHK